MTVQVRRILFGGHLLFNVPDLTIYLDLGDLSPKFKKANLIPLYLPMPKELGEAGQMHSWVSWDDIYKMDQRFKWGGAEIGRKIHMLRMWARNKDADLYFLNRTGGMELIERRPQELAQIYEVVEIISEQINQEYEMTRRAKHQQDKKAVGAFYDKVAEQKREKQMADTPLNKPATTSSAIVETSSHELAIPRKPVNLAADSDLNLELMAIIENVQVESIKERREMRTQMEGLIRAEQANSRHTVEQVTHQSEAMMQQMSGLLRHISDKFDPMLHRHLEPPQEVVEIPSNMDQMTDEELTHQAELTIEDLIRQDMMEMDARREAEEAITINVDSTTAPVKKRRKRGTTKRFAYAGPPKHDPLPDQPPIIGRDERGGTFVRESVGDGYMTAKMFLQKKGKPSRSKNKHRWYFHSLGQKARFFLINAGRLHEIYHVPSTNPTRGQSANSSNEAAYPIEVLEEVFPLVEFD